MFILSGIEDEETIILRKAARPVRSKQIEPSVIGVSLVVLSVLFPKIREVVLASMITRSIYSEASKLERFKI